MPDAGKAENATSATHDESPFLSDWGFTLKDLYGLALSFFKGTYHVMYVYVVKFLK